MGLIEKSVSDIERKTKYARIVLRVLKECNLLKEWSEYITTKEYQNFAEQYAKLYENCTKLWYDRENCADIFGSCNFSYFIERYCSRVGGNGGAKMVQLLLAYLAIFEEKEYYAYCKAQMTDIEKPADFIASVLSENTYDFLSLDGFRDIIEKWLKIKNVKDGNEN